MARRSLECRVDNGTMSRTNIRFVYHVGARLAVGVLRLGNGYGVLFPRIAFCERKPTKSNPQGEDCETTRGRCGEPGLV